MTEMGSDQRHLTGVALVTGSTAFFALAGVFTKVITADPWTIAGWRGFVGAALIGIYVLWRQRQNGDKTSLRLGWRGWLLVVVGAASSILFIASFKYTYVANVAVIYATVPFIAAAIEWIAFGEHPRLRTMIIAMISLIGVAIIVSGGLGGANLFGDLLASAMTAGCALYLVMIRTFRDTPVVWAAAVSALLLFAASWFVVDPLAVSARDVIVMCTVRRIVRRRRHFMDGRRETAAGGRSRAARHGGNTARGGVRLVHPGGTAASNEHRRWRGGSGRRADPCQPRHYILSKSHDRTRRMIGPHMADCDCGGPRVAYLQNRCALCEADRRDRLPQRS